MGIEHERVFRSRLASVFERAAEPATIEAYWLAVARAAIDPFIAEEQADAHVDACAARLGLDGPLAWGALSKRSAELSLALSERFHAHGSALDNDDPYFDRYFLVDHVLGLDRARYESAIASLDGALAIARSDAFVQASLSRMSLARVLWGAFERMELGVVLQAVEPIAVREREPSGALDFDDFAIVHPRYGVGVARRDTSERGALECCFVDAERTLEGDDAYWRDPRAVFRAAAVEQLERRAGNASDERFWSVVAELGWDDTAPIDACGARLAARCSLEECVMLHSRMYRKKSELRARVEAWERESGTTISIGDDGMNDLLCHVIGLGGAEYHASFEDPSRVSARADEQTFAESFAYVFQHAERSYAPEIYTRALAPLAVDWDGGPPPASRVVRHPLHGLGVITRTTAGSVSIAFEDQERQFAT
jgi:hypothetical protein